MLRNTLLGGLLAVIAGASLADTLLIDGLAADSQSSNARPTRGMSMQSVESQFGRPSERRAAVGEPPISRWEYPGFTVFFEHEHVIHAVARR